MEDNESHVSEAAFQHHGQRHRDKMTVTSFVDQSSMVHFSLLKNEMVIFCISIVKSCGWHQRSHCVPSTFFMTLLFWFLAH